MRTVRVMCNNPSSTEARKSMFLGCHASLVLPLSALRERDLRFRVEAGTYQIDTTSTHAKSQCLLLVCCAILQE